MAYFLEAALSDSLTFKAFNQNAKLISIINSSIQTGTTIDESYISEQLNQIKRTRISPLADKVLNAYKNGSIVLIYNKVTQVPKALPFTILRIRGKLQAFIFLGNYGDLVKGKTIEGGDYIDIPMKNLYSLMEGAYVGLAYNNYPSAVTRNLGLMKLSINIYQELIMRILNRNYSLNMDMDSYNNISLSIGLWFAEHIWGSTNKEIDYSYSIANMMQPNKALLSITEDSYRNAGIETIDDLIIFIKTLTPRIDELNLRYFIQCYLTLYKPSAIFSLEVLPYFFYTITSSLIGSFLVNQVIISDIVKLVKGTNKFYPELVKSL